jgi:hypothetical protein
MEMSQGNSLYSYLKQTKIFFSFIKLENRSMEQDCQGTLVPVGGRRMWGKGVGGWTWCKYCVYMYVNGKVSPIEMIAGMGGDKREWWKGWI